MARALALAGAAAMGAACVTTYEDSSFFGSKPEPMPVTGSVTIPIGWQGAGPNARQLAELYGGILERMQRAAADRDVAQLQTLLDQYERSDLPAGLVEHLSGFRAVLAGLRFQRHAAERAVLAVVPRAAADAAPAPATAAAGAAATAVGPTDAVPPLGEPLSFELSLPAPATAVLLGGREDEDPVFFSVSITVEDALVDGGTRSASKQDFVWLPAALSLGGNTVLRLPVAVDAPAGFAVRRDVHLRIDLMPGYVRSAGLRAPIQRTSIGACMVSQWPAGSDKVAAAPLARLQAALRAFEPDQFVAAWIAASFTRGAERSEAQRLLIEQVRFGRADQAQVAMAALYAITDAGLPIGDRDAWLAWWQARR